MKPDSAKAICAKCDAVVPMPINARGPTFVPNTAATATVFVIAPSVEANPVAPIIFCRFLPIF